MMNGILRIQTYRPRQSAPVEGVTVVITGSGFTAHRITDARAMPRMWPSVPRPAPLAGREQHHDPALCRVQPDGQKAGYRTVRIQASRSLPGRSRWPGLR